MPKDEIDEAKEHYGRRLSVEEFLVDFLGGLVPGLLFLTGVVLVLLPAAQSLTMALSNGKQAPPGFGIPKILAATQNTPSALWIAVFIGVVLIGYVVGHLFYRLDPKTPDRSGFNLLASKPENKEEQQRRENLGCKTAHECEFPYPNYHHYLERRGLTHLIPFVLWRTHDTKRSKTYINLLKIRLRHYFPNKYGVLIRNEAHVRLASSAWYVSRVLIFTSIVSLATIGGCMASLVLARHAGTWSEVLAQQIPLVIPPLLVFAFAWFAEGSIKRFFHYQRLREVFFVLETAHTAFREHFDLLFPPFDPQALKDTLNLASQEPSNPRPPDDRKMPRAEPSAAPNGGPAALSGSSGVTEGPPSVS